MIASLSKQGGRRYPQMRSMPNNVAPIGALGTTVALPVFRRTLAAFGTRVGNRQEHKPSG